MRHLPGACVSPDVHRKVFVQHSNDAHSQTSYSLRLSAGIMLILLVAGGILGLSTLTKSILHYDGPTHSWDAWIKGEAARKVEGDFEDTLPIRQAAISGWTAFTSLVFKTASNKIHIGKQGWYYTTEELQYYPDGAAEYARKIELISDVKHFLDRRNIALLVTLVPAKARIYPEYLNGLDFPHGKRENYRQALDDLQAKGVKTLDLMPVFEEFKKNGGPAFLRTDTHWSPAMAGRAAKALATKVLFEFPDMQLPRTDFVTAQGEGQPFLGDLPKRMVPTGPFQKWVGPYEEIMVPYKTEKKAGEAEEGLFEDQFVPVVLLGTSYSADSTWNFEGALKTALQADVLNLAEKGRGPIFPLEEFFKSTDFKNNPPKLVIWEIPERSLEVPYDFNQEAPSAVKAINEMKTKEYP